MKYLLGLITFYLLMSSCQPLQGQHVAAKKQDFSKHGLVIGSNVVLSGSNLEYRTDIKIGYMYFDNRSLYKSTFEFGTKSSEGEFFEEKESALSYNFSYERLFGKYFSLGAFISPTVRYYSKTWDSEAFTQLNDDEYMITLGFAPRAYQIFGRNYLSVGLHLPFVELGMARQGFLLIESEPTLPTSLDKFEFREESGANLFQKEVRVVALYAYRF